MLSEEEEKEFKQDCEEFGKDVAKLIRAFESKPERQEYRSRRRDHVANVNAKRIEFNINKLFVNYKNLMENKHTKISNKSINMDSERTIWFELRSSPKLVQEKFAVDCRFIRHQENWCDSDWKLAHLRDLNEKYKNAKVK